MIVRRLVTFDTEKVKPTQRRDLNRNIGGLESANRQRQLQGLLRTDSDRFFSTEDGGVTIEPVAPVTCPHCGKTFMPYA